MRRSLIFLPPCLDKSWWDALGVCYIGGPRLVTFPFDLRRRLLGLQGEETARLAFLLQGTKGDGPALIRLATRLRYPGSLYALHLDTKASEEERQTLLEWARGQRERGGWSGLWVIDPPSRVTYMGVSMVELTLRGLAQLLEPPLEAGLDSPAPWSHFINLSATDYPLASSTRWVCTWD